MEQAIKSNNPVIASIALVNKNSAKAILVLLLADVINFLNVGQTMGETQLAQTVDLILEDVNFKNLKPDDFRVCFDNAKKGFYGKSYNRIDGMVICEWLSLYCSERANVCEIEAIKKAQEDKSKQNLISPEIVNFYKEVLEAKPVNDKITTNVKIIDGKYVVDQIILPKDESGKVVNPEKKKIVKTERDLFIQKCLFEFDAIYKDFPVKSKNGRFILHNGKEVDQIEYTQMRLHDYEK